MTATGPGSATTAIRTPWDSHIIAQPEATGNASDAADRLGRAEDGDGVEVKGEFASVSAGYAHTCGVRADGTVACWGNQARGVTQADFE